MIIKENNKLLLNKSLLKGTLFSLFSFINKGLVFLLLLILANFIAPAEYGYLGLFSTVAMVVGYFVAMSSEGYFSYRKTGNLYITGTGRKNMCKLPILGNMASRLHIWVVLMVSLAYRQQLQ